MGQKFATEPGAAVACLHLAGRIVAPGDLRDAVHLARAGEQLGPDGAVFRLWRRAARLRLERDWKPRLAALLPEGAAEILARAAAPGAGNPVAVAAGGLRAALDAWPRGEAAAFILGDALLARALGWSHPVPLLASGLRRGDPRAEAEAFTLACHRAVVSASLEALTTAGDLAARAARLRAVLPKLRARGADAAVQLLLSEDALSPGIALSPVIRGSAMRMSDRAARRLCDRLVDLGAARELTGRSSFRLYGL